VYVFFSDNVVWCQRNAPRYKLLWTALPQGGPKLNVSLLVVVWADERVVVILDGWVVAGMQCNFVFCRFGGL
jgi:hypothetical protein